MFGSVISVRSTTANLLFATVCASLSILFATANLSLAATCYQPPPDPEIAGEPGPPPEDRPRGREGYRGPRPRRDRPNDDGGHEARPMRGGRDRGERHHGREQRFDHRQLLALEVLREKLPDMYKQLRRLEGKNQAKFDKHMRKIVPMVMEYIALRDHHPELAESIFEEYKIEEKLRKLSRQYQQAGDDAAQQQKLETEIRELVEQQYVIRRKRMETRLEEFAERLRAQQTKLEQERARLAEEQTKRDELIADRVEKVKQGIFKRGPDPRGPGPRGPRRGKRQFDGPPPGGPEMQGDSGRRRNNRGGRRAEQEREKEEQEKEEREKQDME